MGNTACASYAAPGGSVKVVSSDGEFYEYACPVCAAELMVENPGQFVCDASHLRVGCRVPGLAADKQLEHRRRRLYFLLPMDMLFSVLTEEEMAALACTAAAAMKKGARAASVSESKSVVGGRIFPVLTELCLVTAEAKPLNELAGSVKRPMSRQPSWKPVLETIQEIS